MDDTVNRGEIIMNSSTMCSHDMWGMPVPQRPILNSSPIYWSHWETVSSLYNLRCIQEKHWIT